MKGTFKKWFVLAVVLVAFTPIVIDMTILHIAVPSLTQALNASGTQVLWIIDIYAFLMAGLLVPMGTLADRVGAKKILTLGVVVFGLASLGAAFSTSAEMLIGFRALLALGGAMITPSVLSIIRQTFEDPKERAFALGMWVVVGSVGAAMGPLIGGALLEYFWWGSVFLINIPMVLIILPLAIVFIPKALEFSKNKWSLSQALLFIAALLILVYAIKSGLRPNTHLETKIMVFLLGFTLLAVFITWQLRSRNPLLELGLFKNPALGVGILMAFISMGSLAGFELLLAQELQYVYDKTPLQTGLFMIPLIVGFAVGGPIASFLYGRLGLKVLSVGGLMAASGSFLGLGLLDLNLHYAWAGVFLVILGFALGTGLLSASIAIMDGVPPEKAGAAGSLEGTGYELGSGLGIVLFGALVTTIYQASFEMPVALAAKFSEAAFSIGEAFSVAQSMERSDAALVTQAAKVAFSQAHSFVLLTAAAMIGIVGLVVFYVLSLPQAKSTENLEDNN